MSSTIAYLLTSQVGYSTSDNHAANDKALRLLAKAINESRKLDLGSDAEHWDPVVHRVR